MILGIGSYCATKISSPKIRVAIKSSCKIGLPEEREGMGKVVTSLSTALKDTYNENIPCFPLAGLIE